MTVPTGWPSASTIVPMRVLSPPRERPVARSPASFLPAGAAPMSAHDGAVHQRVSGAGIGTEMRKDPLPDAVFGPAAETRMHIFPVTEALRQVTLGNAGAATEQHGLDEQAAIGGRRADPSFPPWQQVGA